MEMGTDDYREQLLALNQQFADLLPGRLDEIESVWKSLTGGDWDRDKLREMVRSVHVLSGSASTFGYTDLGRAAIVVEKRVKSWIELEKSPTERALERVSGLVVKMRQAADRRDEPARLRSLGGIAEDGNSTVLVVDDEPAVRGMVSSALEILGFQVATHGACLSAAKKAIAPGDSMNRWHPWRRVEHLARWPSRELQPRDRSHGVSRAARAPASGRPAQ